MATEVAAAMADERHLLVQAGTGTGKSLGYLVPALLCDKRVVVATATLALQHQLVERDIPRLMAALADQPGIDTSYAVLKGRSNYACLHRIRSGVPDEQGELIETPIGAMAQKVLELRAWAEEQVSDGGSGSATTPRATPNGSGVRSASTTASAWGPPSALSGLSASQSRRGRRRSAHT